MTTKRETYLAAARNASMEVDNWPEWKKSGFFQLDPTRMTTSHYPRKTSTMTSTIRSRAAFPYNVHVVARNGEDINPVRAGLQFSPEDGIVHVFDPGYTNARVTLLVDDLSEVVDVGAGGCAPTEALLGASYLHESIRYVKVTARYADLDSRIIYWPLVEFRFRPRRV